MNKINPRALSALSVFVILLLPLSLHARVSISGVFGTNMHLVARYYQEDWDTALTKAKDNGVEWAREEFSWEVIEPINDSYNWTPYDAAIDEYNAKGIEVLGLLTYSTEWASSNAGASDYEYYAPDMDAWDDYVTQIATRYAGKVSAWEIWNEPNTTSFWKSSEEDYITLLATASAAIREADANAIIVLGGTSGADSDFIDRVYSQVSDKDIFDVVALHPYRMIDDNFNYNPEQSQDGLNNLQIDLENVRTVLRRHEDTDKPIWLTEFGWTTYDSGITEERQADYLMRGFTMALSCSQVRKVFWYTFRDDSDNTEYLESSFGLINRDFTDKEALTAYNFMHQRLNQRKYVEGSLANTTTLDNFDQKSGWEFVSSINSDGHINEGFHGNLKVYYQFNAEENSYLPISKRIKLPNNTKAISFQAKGSNDSTLLRVRIKDRTNEVFQYNLGYLPSSFVTYRVNLNNFNESWNGDEDGLLDEPLYFDSFIIDDNPDGSKASGNVYFDDLQSSKMGSVYLYEFKQGQNKFYLAWTKSYPRHYRIYLKDIDQVMVRTLEANTLVNGINHYFNLPLSRQPIFLQVKS